MEISVALSVGSVLLATFSLILTIYKTRADKRRDDHIQKREDRQDAFEQYVELYKTKQAEFDRKVIEVSEVKEEFEEIKKEMAEERRKRYEAETRIRMLTTNTVQLNNQVNNLESKQMDIEEIAAIFREDGRKQNEDSHNRPHR